MKWLLALLLTVTPLGAQELVVPDSLVFENSAVPNLLRMMNASIEVQQSQVGCLQGEVTDSLVIVVRDIDAVCGEGTLGTIHTHHTNSPYHTAEDYAKFKDSQFLVSLTYFAYTQNGDQFEFFFVILTKTMEQRLLQWRGILVPDNNRITGERIGGDP